jgi:RNA polymerase sigma-70 factor (ECF subfamily)
MPNLPDKPSPLVIATVQDAYPVLRRFFAKKVGPAEVQDLAHATIVTFLEKHSAAIEHPRRYLFAIARNKLLQHFDRRREGLPFDSQQLSLRQIATTLGTKLHRSSKLIEAMRELPLECQLALELRYGEELELKEVAEAMDKSLAQIKRYIRAGLDRLREQLGTESDVSDDERLGRRLGTEYRES